MPYSRCRYIWNKSFLMLSGKNSWKTDLKLYTGDGPCIVVMLHNGIHVRCLNLNMGDLQQESTCL